MTENVQRQLEMLPELLSAHLLLTVLPLTLGLLVSLPLAVLVTRVQSLRWPTLTVVGVIQTIPGLALLALMVPLLAGVGSLLGMEVPTLGLLPAVLALTLYSMLPIVQNTVTGIGEVDPSLTDVARGLGMTDAQILFRVELPLAAPVILAGVRTATVWVVGVATLATPVGQPSLGNYIFAGLQTRNLTAVLFGCLGAAALAILLDALVGAVERALEAGSRPALAGASAAVVAVVAAGLLAPWCRASEAGPTVQIGAKTFTEQYILAAALERQLGAAGLASSRRESLGSTVVFDALVQGEIDVYVDYTGTIWANHMGGAGPAAPEEVLADVTAWLAEEHGVRCLGALGFDNAYALAMARAAAEAGGIRTLRDLGPASAGLSLGADYEFLQRPEWGQVRDAYGLAFAASRTYDPAFLYEAASRGEVDVISAFSSDGRIAAFDLQVLDDPDHALPPYDAVLLLSPRASADATLVGALEPLVGAIDIDAMRRANRRVDTDGWTPDRAAAELLDAVPR